MSRKGDRADKKMHPRSPRGGGDKDDGGCGRAHVLRGASAEPQPHAVAGRRAATRGFPSSSRFSTRAPHAPLQPSASAASRPRRSACRPLRYRQPHDDAGAEHKPKPKPMVVAEEMSRPTHALQREISSGKRLRGQAGRPPRATLRAPNEDKPKAPPAIDDDDGMCAEEPDAEAMRMLEEEKDEVPDPEPVPTVGEGAAWKRVAWHSTETRTDAASTDRLVGDPVPDGEARRRWPHRYNKTKGSAHSCARRRCADWEGEQISARCHYTSASVDGVIFNLNDDVFIKVISPKLLKVPDHEHNDKRVFLSEEQNDNLIESIICKLNIVYVDPDEIPQAKDRLISNSDFYYDMSYSVACSTFANMPAENDGARDSDATSDICSEEGKPVAEYVASPGARMETTTLLDLYSGCGAMSTGLCLGAAVAGMKLNTKWAVDLNSHACESLKHNQPSTQVRNEKAEDFLSLLQQWEAVCKKYVVHGSNSLGSDLAQASRDDEDDKNGPLPKDVFEVERLVDISYGNPSSTRKDGLWFKVRWKQYDATQDTWEPIDGLSDSSGCIKEFVHRGYRNSILPLPGSVDVICGGPPCQGVSGFNRFREHEDPLKDEKNRQLVVFMDIVNYLRPKYVLMENVVDILKFADGFLGRYALSRLLAMNYQARLGMMVAGCYGLAQFRMRAFIWGALPSEVLPKFPLPTHYAVKRVIVPNAFSRCLVAYEETADKHLKKALVLEDAISDLPEVENHRPNDVMEYDSDPNTEFQRYIRRC